MIKNFLLTVLFPVLIFTGCKIKNDHPDVDNVQVNFQLLQLEKDIFEGKDSMSAGDVAALRTKYSTFFDLYCRNMLRLPAPNDSLEALQLNGFKNDKDIQEVYSQVKTLYTEAEIESIKAGLTGFFKHLKYYFPEKVIPNAVTYVSGFNYNVVTTDSVLGIGLDMYLGDSCRFYPALSFPQYMFRKFSKEYIVSDCIKGWFRSEYDAEAVKKELLSQIVYEGKLLYFMDAMAPEMNDTLKIGYTGEQLKWSGENEEQMWAFFIEKKMLYSSNEKEYIRFIQDGRTTQGFPEGAPGKTGCYIGWQIVRAYMKNNDVTLQQLLKEEDAQKILTESGYKPRAI